MSMPSKAVVEPAAVSASTKQLQPQPICWLLRAKQSHPNLTPLAEEDWQSLLATAREELRRG
jgi:hypothetical protein